MEKKIGGDSYRMRLAPPGTGRGGKKECWMCIIESMPVKIPWSLYPNQRDYFKKEKKLTVRGHAWAGELEVQKWSIYRLFGMDMEGMFTEETFKIGWLGNSFHCAVDFPKQVIMRCGLSDNSQGKSQPIDCTRAGI